MEETTKRPNIESTLKSLDTEEFIDIHFYRPIGYRWALFFNKLGVSPMTDHSRQHLYRYCSRYLFLLSEPDY